MVAGKSAREHQKLSTGSETPTGKMAMGSNDVKDNDESEASLERFADSDNLHHDGGYRSNAESNPKIVNAATPFKAHSLRTYNSDGQDRIQRLSRKRRQLSTNQGRCNASSYCMRVHYLDTTASDHTSRIPPARTSGSAANRAVAPQSVALGVVEGKTCG